MNANVIILPETARMKYGQSNIKKCVGSEPDISRGDALLLLSGVLRLLQKQMANKEEGKNIIN